MFDACQPGREGLERGEAVMLGRQQSQEDVAVARVVREQDRRRPTGPSARRPGADHSHGSVQLSSVHRLAVNSPLSVHPSSLTRIVPAIVGAVSGSSGGVVCSSVGWSLRCRPQPGLGLVSLGRYWGLKSRGGASRSIADRRWSLLAWA